MFLCVYPSKNWVIASWVFGSVCGWFDPVFTKLITTGRDQDLGLVLGIFDSLKGFTQVFAPILFTATFAVGALWTFVLVFIFNALGFFCVVLVLNTVKDETAAAKAYNKLEHDRSEVHAGLSSKP